MLKAFFKNLMREALAESGSFSDDLGGTAQPIVDLPGVHRPAESVLMVYGCLTARREAIGSVPLRVSDAEGNLVDDGPLVRLLARPNQYQTWGQYVRQLETYLALYDAVAVAKVGDPIDELVPLCPSTLRPDWGVHVPTGVAVPVRWNYVDPVSGSARTFKPEDLIIHRGFNPHAPLMALSPLTVLSQSIQQDVAARQMNLYLASNNSTPPLVLQTKGAMSKQQAEEVLDVWEGKMRGIQKRGKTAVLWGGLEAQKLGLTPAEMEYLNGLKFLRTDYYIAFRIVPAMVGEMLGETGLSQGNSTDQQIVKWWETVGLAELDLIAGLHEQALAGLDAGGMNRAARKLSRMESWTLQRSRNRSGAAAGAGLKIWFDDNVIPALVRTRLAKLDQFEKAAKWGFLPDDLSAWLDLGLPPHPTNVGLVPMGFQPVDDLQTPAAALQTPAAGSPQRGADLAALVDLLGAALERTAESVPTKWTALRKALDRILAAQERAAASKYSRFFLEQRDRVLARLMAMGSDALPRQAAAADIQREDLEAFIGRIFPMADEDAALIKRMSGLLQEQIEAGWKMLGAEVGLKTGTNPFTIDDPRVRTALERRKIQCTKINATTQEDLRRIIGETLDAGASTTELGDSIAKYYGKECIGVDGARAQTAARTQVAGIVNDGRMAAAESVGGLKKGWLHGGSEMPRPSHIAAMQRYLGNPIPLDEPFDVGGVLMNAPGDPDAPADEVCNCSCMVVFSME